jgi:DAACS family dicarboxylate/amino acid:cation (Na+ or H+) symporter
LIALVAGAILGVLVNVLTHSMGAASREWLDRAIRYVMEPVGQIFLRMLFMTVIPLVFASLALGVAQLGGRGNLGRIGLKTMAFFVTTMAFAVVLGLVLVNTIKPGAGLSEETRDALQSRYGQEATSRTSKLNNFGVQTFVNIVPKNPLQAMVEMDMLAVIFAALMTGLGITQLPSQQADLLRRFLEAVNELMIVMIGWAMKLAPFGVFALIFAVTSRFGFDVMKTLGWYVAVVLSGLAIQMFVVMPILMITLGRVSPLKLFKKARAAIITAFSTSSSNATLPTSIRVAEQELGVPPSIAGFVLPLGATMNMNGTALFEGVTVMFLAQVFGVDLKLTDQLIVVVLSVLTSTGAAGVPGGSLPLLAMVLSTVQVPAEGIALILGVDRILDMCRTTLNSFADIVAAVCVARSEGILGPDVNL